jgi:hypothetical protein
MICPHCAFPNDPGVSVCSKCHNAFNDAPADALAEVMKAEAQPIQIGSHRQGPEAKTIDTTSEWSPDETPSTMRSHIRNEPAVVFPPASVARDVPVQPAAPASVRAVWVAGFWLRLAALLIDVVAVTGVMSIMVMLSWLLRGSGGEGAFDFFIRNPKALLVLAIMYLLLMGTYLALFTRFGGQSLGQILLGLQVIHETGQQLTTKQVLRRMVGIVCATLPG